MQGKGKNETNYKRKEKKEKGVLLVYATDLPACMQGFRILVIANVDGHMRITGRQTWV